MVKIRNRRRGKLRLSNGVLLAPGDNDIDDAVWAQCVQSPVTTHYMKRDELEVLPGPVSHTRPVQELAVRADIPYGPGAPPSPYVPESPPLPPPVGVAGNLQEEAALVEDVLESGWDEKHLDGLKARDAVAAIEAHDNLDDLKSAYHREARATVRRALVKRISKIEQG